MSRSQVDPPEARIDTRISRQEERNAHRTIKEIGPTPLHMRGLLDHHVHGAASLVRSARFDGARATWTRNLAAHA